AQHGLRQRLAQRTRFVEEDGAVGPDAVAVAAAEETVDRLLADLAHQVPQRDVDAADGVLDGAAPALPEHALPQLLADAGRLVGALADEVLPQHADAGRDESLARHGAADADQPLVGDDLDDGVEVFLGPVALRPAAVHGAAGQAGKADIDDLHWRSLMLGSAAGPPLPFPPPLNLSP